jgi:beta-N-acetylhexosaminidase
VIGALLGAACRTAPVPPRVAALEPDLGQLLLVGFHGVEPGDGEQERLLCQVRVGGVALFARNVVDTAQVRRLTAWMQARSRACTGRPLLVAVDAEGGSVMRLGPAAGYSATLSAGDLGQANDVALTELEARRIGARLAAAGVNWNLAPVVDVGFNPANPVVVRAGRSFGASPARVTAHARAFVRGMRAEGILTALKHFPGHGSSYADSHQGFVDVSETARHDLELPPYRALIAERLADAVMTAHVFNRSLDDEYPATLSRPTIEGLLRDRLGFRGPVVSDDLRMRAIDERYGLRRASVLALQAGLDILLLADDRLPGGRSAADLVLGAIRQALARERLSAARVLSALSRIALLKSRLPDPGRAPERGIR